MTINLTSKLDSVRVLHEAEQDSIQAQNLKIANIPSATKIEQSVNVYDDVLKDYAFEEGVSLDIHKVSDFNKSGIDVDVNKIFLALDKINIDDPQYNPLIEKIVATDNWMYRGDTPKVGSIRARDWESNMTDKYEDTDPFDYVGWTAANAWGMGVGNILGESPYFDSFNNEMETQYDKMIDVVNPIGPNFLWKSWFLMDEQDIGLDIEALGGKEAYDKAEYIAKGVAKEEQLKYMRKCVRIQTALK